MRVKAAKCFDIEIVAENFNEEIANITAASFDEEIIAEGFDKEIAAIEVNRLT